MNELQNLMNTELENPAKKYAEPYRLIIAQEKLYFG